ncbi:Nucleoside-triphosphatase THEP1 [Gossypium australe]|uniref:Nucleoside-triphosphatase THEP1 n=1 Tax=Gossypium australe TaxID=47621 RepID=A0A5B6V9E1_9ROSI|nr:Nucleoside-triphosphatase THEP1 [Gossypium australe]
MEKGFLDRVEDNAAVQVWSERIQREKGDSLTVGYESELWDFTRVSVAQNDLRELKEIWDSWGNEDKQLFYHNYGDLHYLLDIKVDEYLLRAITQFWNPAYSCFTFGKVDLVPTIEEYTALFRCPRIQTDKAYSRVDVFALSIYGLVIFPKALGHIEDAVSDLFDKLDKGVTPIPAILAETFRSLNACRRAGEGRFIGCAQLLLSWFHCRFWKMEKVLCKIFFENYSPLKELEDTPRRDDLSGEKWIAILQNLQVEDVEWKTPWMIPDEILYRCGEFDWVPLLGI